MAKKSFTFDLGNYVKNVDGSYSKINRVESAYIKQQRDVNKGLVVKEKVNNSPDFQVKVNTEWFIPYQIPSKKNSRQVFVHPKTKKLMNIPSKSYSEYKQLTKRYWEVFGIEFRKSVELLGLQYPLNIEMTFTRSTNQLIDFFGPGESVFDLMTDFDWWEDDNRRFGKPFFGDMIVDKLNPGTRIKILTNK